MRIPKGSESPSLRGILLLVILTISLDPTYVSGGYEMYSSVATKVRTTLLKDSILEEYKSDDRDKYSDLLIRKFNGNKKPPLTYYYGRDPQQPVFITDERYDTGNQVYVLQHPSEDYIENERDKNGYNYAVLLQRKSKPDTYALHIAQVVPDSNLSDSTVTINWSDGRVEQQKNLREMLELMIRKNSTKKDKIRPLCCWVGYILLCDAQKYVKPLRPRAVHEPLDDDDHDVIFNPGADSNEIYDPPPTTTVNSTDDTANATMENAGNGTSPSPDPGKESETGTPGPGGESGTSAPGAGGDQTPTVIPPPETVEKSQDAQAEPSAPPPSRRRKRKNRNHIGKRKSRKHHLKWETTHSMQ